MFYWHWSHSTMWNQAGGGFPSFWDLKKKTFTSRLWCLCDHFLSETKQIFIQALTFSSPIQSSNNKTASRKLFLSEAKLHLIAHWGGWGLGVGGSALLLFVSALSFWPFTVWLLLLVLSSLGTLQRHRRGQTGKSAVANDMQTSFCFMKVTPDFCGFRFDGKWKNFNTVRHRNLLACRGRTLRAAARNGDYALKHNALVILFPKSVAARNTWENARISPSQSHLIVAHRSKRQPE